MTLEQEFRQAFGRHQAGDLSAAELGYRRVLRDQPRHPEALYLLGSLHAQRMDYAGALTHLRQAAALDPRQARYFNNLGIALKETGGWEEAEDAYTRALALKPDYPEAFNNRGILCKDRGRHAEAITWFRRAVASRPDYADAHNNLGLALQAAEEMEEAAESFRRAVTHSPGFAAAQNNLGAVLRLTGRLEEAAAHVEKALALRPDFAEAYNNWGIILHEMTHAEEAEASFRRALALCPHYPDALLNLGTSVQAQGRFDEAKEHFDAVIALEPQRHDAHFNRGLIQLMRGESEAGWEEYEWRHRDPKAKPSPYRRPRWDGSSLAGRTLLVHAEQGFGDTFQFIRYLTLIPKDGGRVVFECQPGTKTLLAGCAGFDEIIERSEANVSDDRTPHDVQIPLMSLPRLFPRFTDAPPVPVPYLFAPTDKIALWRDRLAEVSASVPGHLPGNLKVGLVWAGNPTHKNDKNRSASLADFGPLARIPGVTLYSLQIGPAERQAADPPSGMTLVDLAGAIGDFTDTAGVIMNLDVVIAVDTSTAHLAGALGRPVWLLVPFSPEWRWMEKREDSPWYPSMRLFRQIRRRDWAPVFAHVADALAEQTGQRVPAVRIGDEPTVPKISVLMCTYNRAEMLPRVLKSYAEQTLPPGDFELILVDDASTDATQECLAGYAPPFPLIYHRQSVNRGIGAARKQSVALARGEIVLFADDDETVRPDYLEQHLRTHRAYPQENYGAHARIELAPEVADSVTMQVLTGAPGLYHYFDDIPDGAELDFRYFWTNVVSVKRSFLTRHEPFDDTTRAQEDVEMGRRLGQSGLVLIHNKRAVMDTLRRMTYAQFCRRQDRIGAATAWLVRKHGQSDVPFWVGVADVEANMASLAEQFDQLAGVEETMEALERAGWQEVCRMPEFRERTLPTLANLCRMRATYLFLAAYVRQMREYHAQEAAHPVVPNTQALVSVVLTGEGDASETIASLRAQSYPHWELVTGEEMRGDYVLCLEASDTLLPACLAECVALLERTPEISFAYGDWEFAAKGGATEAVHEKDHRITATMEHVGLPLKSSAVVRRALCEEIGGLHGSGDPWDFWLSAAEVGRSGRRIPKPLVRSAQPTRSPDAMRRAELTLRHPALFAQAAIRKARGLLAAHQWQGRLGDECRPAPRALVSVILTVRDVGDLAGILERLKTQTYARFEVILVNGSGTVLVRRGLRQIRQPLTVINASPQATPGEARNLGIRAASGKYLTYLDEETGLTEGHLEVLVSALEQTEYQIAHTSSAQTDQDGFDYDNILIGNPVPPSALMHTRDCLEAVGEFDPALSSGDEWDMWIRLSRHHDVLHLPIVTCLSNHNDVTQIRAQDVQAIATVFQKHRALLPDMPLFTRMQQAVLDQIGVQAPALKPPKISVLMCTYNRLDLLPRVLDSYAHQTLAHDQYEVILVDDASTDGTPQFLSAYVAPHPMTCHRQAQNAGIAVGRNQALALARGEIVVFVDDDETARPDYLEQHLRTHAQHPQETVAVCGRVELGAEAAASVTMHVLTENPGLYHYFDDLQADRTYDFRHFWGNVVSAKRSFLVKHGGFDAETQAQEDVEFGWRLHPHGLTVRYNPAAILDTLRVMTLPQFLRRQARIGAASAWLTRKHPHPEVVHWLGVTDAEARLPDLERHAVEAPGIAQQLESLERAGWARVCRMPGFRERTLAALADWVKKEADREFLTAYVHRVREDRAQPNAADHTAHVSVILTPPASAELGPENLASAFGLDAQTHPYWDLTVTAGSEDPYADWNRAAAQSSGKYLLRLGEMDVLSPTFLAECVALLERAPEISLVYTDASTMDGSQVMTANDYSLVHRPEEPGLPPNTGVVFRRSAWNAADGWPAGMNPDWHLWQTCGGLGHLGRRIPKPLLHQRSRPEALAAALSLETEVARAERLFGEGNTAAAAALFQTLNEQYPAVPRILNNLGVLAWSAGDKIGGLRHFRDALAVAPSDRTTLLNCADALRALGRVEEAQRLLAPLQHSSARAA